MPGFGSINGALAAADGLTDGAVVAAGGSTDGVVGVAVDGSIGGDGYAEFICVRGEILCLSSFLPSALVKTQNDTSVEVSPQSGCLYRGSFQSSLCRLRGRPQLTPHVKAKKSERETKLVKATCRIFSFSGL
jgi:hypothetical protein